MCIFRALLMFNGPTKEQKPFYLLLAIIIVSALFDFGYLTANNIAAFSTLVIAFFTVFLVFETRDLRKQNHLQSIKPKMDIYVEKRSFQVDTYKKCVDIVIINNGPGMACKIAIDFKNKSTSDIGGRAFDYVEKELSKRLSRKDLSYLSTGHPQRYFLNLAANRRDYEHMLREYRAEVIISYQDAEQTPYIDKFILDFSDYL